MKKYKNIGEVDRDLEIYAIEREIALRKMLSSAEKTLTVFKPINLVRSGISFLSGSIGGKSTIKSVLYSIIIKQVAKRFLK